VQVPQVALAEALQALIKYFPKGHPHCRQTTSVVALQAPTEVSPEEQSHCRQTTSAVALHAPNEVSPDEQLHRRQTVSAVPLQATTGVVPLGHVEQAWQTVLAVALHCDTRNLPALQNEHGRQTRSLEGVHWSNV
jgi:hypothetical protein